MVQGLAAGVTLSYVSARLGTPVFVRTMDVGNPSFTTWEHVFVLQNGYVQIISDEAGTVLRWSVTTTDRRWCPSFTLGFPGNVPCYDVKLGKTRLGTLPLPAAGLRAMVAARRVFYDEVHYLGNPGLYQHFVLTLNDAGRVDEAASPLGRLNWVLEGVYEQEAVNVGPSSTLEQDRKVLLRELRPRLIPNTFTVLGPSSSLELLTAWRCGPDLDHVRVLGRRG